jgi:hypothetical protein
LPAAAHVFQKDNCSGSMDQAKTSHLPHLLPELTYYAGVAGI